MKKILYFFLLCLAACPTFLFVSCSDDDDVDPSTNRQFMTMFITDYTRNKGTDYPYNCGLDGAYPHGNTIHLYWYGVDNCAGYQIQMALQPKVSNGDDAWNSIQGTSDLLLDTIIKPGQLDLVIPDLQYSTDYRFAIRALSPLDDNVTDFSHASQWYGHGNGRQWQEYLGIKTNDRYPTPMAIYVNQAQTTEETMHVYLNRNLSDLGLDPNNPDDAEELASFRENFNIDENGNLGYKYITVSPSPNNPNSTVGEKWRNYEITDEDWARGYIVVDGLTPNSVYVIDAIDPRVKTAVDAKYNTVTARSDGQPGPPILLNHDSLINALNNAPVNSDYPNIRRSDVFGLASQYNAAPLTPTLHDFISNTKYAEGQTYYLEGGKTYYIDGNDITCKGFTLRTNPADVAKGLRAKVICGIGKNTTIYNNNANGEQWQGSYTMFMFGRQPEAGEGGEIYMKKLAFYDIDFDNPTALNYGDNAAGAGTVAGNYFFNMFSNGMAVTLDSLVIDNCTFKRCVRGFIREQGPNYKVWNHVLMENNQFFDCGYYNQGAGGYPWIAGSANNPATNLFADFKCINNTFYDSPFPCFFAEQTDGVSWTGGPWHITFSNNTMVNFNTRSNGAIFKMRSLPDGSVFNVKNNLFVLTKQSTDQRVLGCWGSDIRSTQTLSDGSAAHVTLNFGNNWSTNDNLTDMQIFTGARFSSNSNSFGTLVKENTATLNGSLDVNVANISATQLFHSPNPPHSAQSASDRNMHRADALDGTAKQYNVNLYYKNTNNDIYNNNVGDPRWRSRAATQAKQRTRAYRR